MEIGDTYVQVMPSMSNEEPYIRSADVMLALVIGSAGWLYGGIIGAAVFRIAFGVAVQKPGLLSSESVDAIWTRPTLDSVESRMSFGWFPTPDASRISINGSYAGVQAGLSVWKEGGLVVAVLANSWGRGSRSGEFMDSTSEGLIGRLAAVCGVY